VLLPPEILALFNIDASTSTADAIDVMIQLVDQDFEDVGEAEQMMLGSDAGHEMALAPVRDDAGDGFIAAVGFEFGTVGVLAFTASGELDATEATFIDMLGTLIYLGPEDAPVPQENAISWEAENIRLMADNFYVIAGGQVFTAPADDVTVSGADSSLEVTWMEHDVEMRVNINVEADDDTWRATDIRFYDGTDSGDWITIEEEIISAPLGESYAVDSLIRQMGNNAIRFENLELEAVISAE